MANDTVPSLTEVITRLRRSTTNGDVITVCDALERFLLVKTASGEVRPKFDRVTYQRELMRKRRAMKPSS